MTQHSSENLMERAKLTPAEIMAQYGPYENRGNLAAIARAQNLQTLKEVVADLREAAEDMDEPEFLVARRALNDYADDLQAQLTAAEQEGQG